MVGPWSLLFLKAGTEEGWRCLGHGVLVQFSLPWTLIPETPGAEEGRCGEKESWGLREASAMGLNRPGHHQDETHERDFDPAWAISAPETAGTRWRL